MSGLSDRFFANLALLGQRRHTDPAFYLAVWCVESGLNPGAVNPHGGARGLNQMMPATLKGLGAPADYEALSGEDQLPWIEKLIAGGERLNGGPFRSAARYYHSNFFPRTMARGDSPSTVVVASAATDEEERVAYQANKGLDASGDGVITLRDLGAVLDHARDVTCPGAFTRLARAVAALPPPGVTWSAEPLPPPPPPPAIARSRRGPLVGAAFALGAVGLVAWRTR